MGDYQYNLHIIVTCDNTEDVILDTSFNLNAQTLASALAQAQTQLSVILAELIALHPGCTAYTARVFDPSLAIDYTVHSSTLVLLIAQVYTELLYILATL